VEDKNFVQKIKNNFTMAEIKRKILIPVDGSPNSQKAFDFYIENLMKNTDEVELLHVQHTPHLSLLSLHDPMNIPVEDWSKQLKDEISKSQKLIAHYEMLCEEHKLAKKTLLTTGKPGEAICNKAKECGADMIVMGSRGLNAVRRTFVGSVSDYVLHHASVPITIVPGPGH